MRARSVAENLHEGFGGQVPQLQGAAEHVRERISNTRPSARRRRRGRWGAWAPEHRGGFSAALLRGEAVPEPGHDVLERGARPEDLGDAPLLQGLYVLLWDDAAAEH